MKNVALARLVARWIGGLLVGGLLLGSLAACTGGGSGAVYAAPNANTQRIR